MKFPLFRRKTFRNIYLIILIAILASPFLSFITLVFPFDMNNDQHFSSWIKSISFSNKESYPEYNITEIHFGMELEVWNPGPFTITIRSGSGALGFPHDFNQTGNSTHIVPDYYLNENDLGVLFPSIHFFRPGIKFLNWTGSMEVQHNESYSNPYLPDGNYSFIFGGEDWQARYGYEISVVNGSSSYYPESPEIWGEGTINLGSPLWYIFGLPLGILFTIEIILNLRDFRNEKIEE